ncbi:hypothetical protein CWB77_08530 [Pseudoalteromonas sp. S1610]|uniref:hypothetical protein n=1 Tax=unclassified Pseudoalteromonas TaxID=194690 RepID=UPI0009491DD4|nr:MULTISPECIES: hypothetical protein [unclassified Pseudoalteromonas]OLF76622.1 hypothetical protein AWH60_07485 [Pseudoalteromonas haloplanktis]MCK8127876.1 DUF4144 domain-containing protein [Pseudoalteromonas sp. 2CM39R]MDN3484638.1 hypothetical protein [Pseudoalteromonas sp. APC 3224]TMP61654.1 hypothetical protein CWB77_08530 [Pseudoalteromonas sp. S1610]TMP71101.1 hypothetical protein CWB76_07455 [Pseudoalteromonas sp. S1609]
MSISYPLIIIYNNEIELLEHADELHDFIYTMDVNEQKNVVILDKVSGYQGLNGDAHNALSAIQLAQLVKEYLAKEGQCCLSKIEQLTPDQAFMLLAEIN